MPERHADWLRQAVRDLAHASHSLSAEEYEWACFAAHQAAEKAIKAVFQRLGGIAWGHSLTMLLQELPSAYAPDPQLLDRARALDKHYIASRYPNGFERGAPLDYYTRRDAEGGIADAEAIIRFCQGILAGFGSNQG